MRQYILLLCCFHWLTVNAQLKLSGKITGLRPAAKVLVNVPFSNWTHQINDQIIQLNSKGEFSVTLPVSKAQTFLLRVDSVKFQLYGEPGKDLKIMLAVEKAYEISFSGKMANENKLRHQLALTRYELISPITDSAAPDDVLNTLIGAQHAAFHILETSKARLSSAFRKITYYDIVYFPPSKIWQSIWNNDIYTTSFKQAEVREAWTKALLKAHEAVKISNDSAVHSYHYQQIISYYPRLIHKTFPDKEAFNDFVSKMFNKPFKEAYNDIRAKGQEFWEYSLYDKCLQGLAREATLASYLVKSYYNGEMAYQQQGFQHFKETFPNSVYLEDMKAIMQPYFASLANDQTDKDIEFAAAGIDYANLDSIIARHKGKVVYVDLWGTWCGPCREEFAYTKELKERFKSKGVEFLYIAFEHTTNPEQYWKEMVRFYNLKGKHMLMGPLLQEYLRGLYKETGMFAFPSYLLFDKQGKLVTIHAKRPSEKENLYAEIEKLL